jgi:hypothetical protein
MEPEKILHFYWDIFLSHLCEFYPLSKEFVAQYEYELDWISLSKNRTITWDLAFLEQYEKRLIWHEIARNEAVLWDETKIDRFKKRLDWFYLGRNKNLPITEAFISRYSKKLFVVEDNSMLTPDLIDKYKLRLLPKDTFDSQTIKDYKDSDFDQVFNNKTFYHNQRVIYEKVFLPIIQKSSIEAIFREKFDYSQRYYFIKPLRQDIHGLTPEFIIDGENPFNVFREDRELIDISQKLTLKNGPLQEGPDRLYEVLRFSTFHSCAILLVSENVKQILEQFKLPNHLYHEVTLNTKKLTTSTRYYILQIAFDTLNKDLVYENAIFNYYSKGYAGREHGQIANPISNHKDLLNARITLAQSIKKVGNDLSITPEKYLLQTDYDLYTFSIFNKIIVNQYIKDALENSFPNQINFISAQLLNIYIDQSVYDNKKSLTINTNFSSKLTYQRSKEDLFYYAKAERLKLSDEAFEASMTQGDKFSKKEIALKVLFPETFKDNYVSKKLKIKGFTLLPISKFYTQSGYAERHPETYKSVVIAENGLGDSVNLILEKDSDYKLQNRLFEFFHETGEYEEIKFLPSQT